MFISEYVGIRGVCDVRPVRGGGGAATTSSGDISSTDSDDGERRPLRPDGGSGACGAGIAIYSSSNDVI